MIATVTRRGRTFVEVRVESSITGAALPRENVIENALAAAGETRARLFGIIVDEVEGIEGGVHYVVTLHTD